VGGGGRGGTFMATQVSVQRGGGDLHGRAGVGAVLDGVAQLQKGVMVHHHLLRVQLSNNLDNRYIKAQNCRWGD